MLPIKTRARSHVAGYTMTEMAIVMAIISVVVGMSVSAGVTQLQTARIGSTKSTLENVREALLVYEKKQGRYPCPADPTDVPGDATYGVAAASACDTVCPAGLVCTGNAVMGAVPFKTIKINPESAIDAWDRKITYVLDKTHTDATTGSGYELGNIKVNDGAGREITASPTLGDAIFVLISHGENVSGAWNAETGVRETCVAGQIDTLNCNDADDMFVDERLNNADIVASFFDDIVVWQAQEKLNIDNPLVASNDCNKPIDGGYQLSCAVASNGTPYCWGRNTKGNWGNGGTVNASTPTAAFGGGTDWVSFGTDVSDASYGHNCGVRSNGTLHCAGENGNGQLGNASTADSLTPVQESTAATDWLEVDVDFLHTCALRTSGRLFCWGANNRGQLGIGSTANQSTPQQVTGTYTDWTDFTVGAYHSCGIRNNGQAFCWGYNLNGQLGDGTTSQRTSPVLVAGGGTNWVKIDSTDVHTCALTQTKRAFCWGRGASGRLGDGGLIDQPAPVEIQGTYTDWDDISAGSAASCGIRAGHLYCWGNRAEYIIPDGGAVAGNQLTPVEASGTLDDWTRVSIDLENGCAIRSSTGKFYCWGRNDFGQVGNGNTTAVNVPTEVSSINACDP